MSAHPCTKLPRERPLFRNFETIQNHVGRDDFRTKPIGDGGQLVQIIAVQNLTSPHLLLYSVAALPSISLLSADFAMGRFEFVADFHRLTPSREGSP
jgi:hypothetical protein